MSKRPVDPISLLFGLLFVSVALIVLFGGSVIDDGHLLVPAGLIGLGIAMFISSRSNGTSGEHRPSDEVRTEGGEDG